MTLTSAWEVTSSSKQPKSFSFGALIMVAERRISSGKGPVSLFHLSTVPFIYSNK